jgi:hypothetical protein
VAQATPNMTEMTLGVAQATPSMVEMTLGVAQATPSMVEMTLGVAQATPSNMVEMIRGRLGRPNARSPRGHRPNSARAITSFWISLVPS